MTVGGFIFQLLISPLELLLETIYGITLKLFANHGLSIVLMSLVMNFLLLPLYKQADVIQQEERIVEKKLEPWVKHIKKTFKGDERFMMLKTFYSQNHYKPYYSLRSIMPLALEIPFFVAAYHFLSNLNVLNTCSLGLIHSLGAPDGLIRIGAYSVNALPILMTLINTVSSTIYTKGLAFKKKITLYGMAFVFLILLYDSPSGLVFYWTLNNLFSLVKNLLYKMNISKKTLIGLVSAVGSAIFVYGLFFYQTDNPRYKAFLVAASLCMQIPLLLYIAGKWIPYSIAKRETNYRLFLCSGIFLTIV